MRLRNFDLDGVGGRVGRERVFNGGVAIIGCEVPEAVIQHPSVAIVITIAAGLRSAAETIICYQRQRFRGSSVTGPGLSQYELGLQTKQAAMHSLVEICAAGEALAAMAFETAGMLDQLHEVGRQPEPTPPTPDLASKTDHAIAEVAFGTARLNSLAGCGKTPETGYDQGVLSV
jgi:alkylation response protein AidB-like acyl-CoA dehydrogenase